MDKLHDDYYYRLGRHMALIEFNSHIEKTIPVGISSQQMAEWKRGYDVMADSLFWPTQKTIRKDKAV